MILEGDDFIHILKDTQFRSGIYIRQSRFQYQTTQLVRAICEKAKDGTGFKMLKLDQRTKVYSNYLENS